MSRVTGHPVSRRLMRAGLLSVSVLTAGLTMAVSAQAQLVAPLRGEITEEQASQDLLLRQRRGVNAGRPTDRTATAQNVAEPQQYQPFSPGAVADEQAGIAGPDTTVTDDALTSGPSDPFAEAPVESQGRPSSARQRAAQMQPAQGRRQPVGSEQPDTTGTIRATRADAEERGELLLDRGAEREAAIEGLDRAPDENPFEAIGIRAGTFILRPSIEQGLTYTTNANSSPDGAEALQSETTLRLNAISDWSENRASLDAYGIYRKSVSGEELEHKETGIDAALDYDLSREFKLKAAAGYSVRPESASSPVFLGNVVEQPLRHTFTGSAGVSKELGKLELGLTGRAERNIYGDADLVGGGVLDQAERNSTLATIALRTGYEISPAITPFAELEVGRRYYDEEFDSAGYQRSADRLALRAGAALDMGEKLTGEFSAGWLRESFDDERLDAISGLSLKGDLRWSPERDTIVGLNASTTVEGTTTAGDSGSLLHSGRLTLERKIRANVTANAALGLDWRTYSQTKDHDLLFSAELGATWWLNRYAGLTGRLRHEQQTSDRSGRDYKAESIFVGVKVQR